MVLDTSAILAIGDLRDRHHERARRALEAEHDRSIVPAGILAEVDHVLTVRVGRRATLGVLDACIDGSLLLDCGDVDPPRIRELMARYHELPLEFADAAVIACAERNGGRILSFDRRSFDVVAADVGLTIAPG
jgi:uncharacterized protein